MLVILCLVSAVKYIYIMYGFYLFRFRVLLYVIILTQVNLIFCISVSEFVILVAILISS